MSSGRERCVPSLVWMMVQLRNLRGVQSCSIFYLHSNCVYEFSTRHWCDAMTRKSSTDSSIVQFSRSAMPFS